MLKTASGSTGLTPTYTYTTLPPASDVAASVIVFVSDWGASGTFARSNGSRWIPIAGRILLKHLGPGVSGIANTATIVLATPAMPIGSVRSGDSIFFEIYGMTKSGTTDALNMSAYSGTTGTTADTNILTGQSVGAAVDLTFSSVFDYKVTANTTVQRVGPSLSFGLYAGQSANAANAPVTIADLSANALIFSFAIAAAGATNTVGIQDGAIWQIVN